MSLIVLAVIYVNNLQFVFSLLHFVVIVTLCVYMLGALPDEGVHYCTLLRSATGQKIIRSEVGIPGFVVHWRQHGYR